MQYCATCHLFKKMMYTTFMASSNTLIRRDSQFITDNMGKNALIKAMRKHGLTATKVIKPVVEALEANRVVITGKDEKAFAEVQPDHSTRLRAAQLAIQLLQLSKDIENPQKEKQELSKTLKDAIKEGNDVEVQRILFNKSTP